MAWSQYHILNQPLDGVIASPPNAQLTQAPIPIDIFFNGTYVPQIPNPEHRFSEAPYLFVAFPELSSRLSDASNVTSVTDIFGVEGNVNSSVSQYLKAAVEGVTIAAQDFTAVPVNAVSLIQLQKASQKPSGGVNTLSLQADPNEVCSITNSKCLVRYCMSGILERKVVFRLQSPKGEGLALYIMSEVTKYLQGTWTLQHNIA